MPTATELFNFGYRDLVSVIPPNAELSPNSKIRPESRGKCPGMKGGDGLWCGYNWRSSLPSLGAAVRIDRDGANVGLKATDFPAIDVDVRDEELAGQIAEFIEKFLQVGPVRVGSWPKRLYMFRLASGEEPFGRMQVMFQNNGVKHLLEILGKGQQYVIGGIHPKTGMPYEWRVPLVPAVRLPTLTQKQADELLGGIVQRFGPIWQCERVGDGRHATRANCNQEDLKAKDLDVLEEAVLAIPNTDATFPSRADYISFGYALRGATQDDPARGLEMYQEWASRWEGGNDPEYVASTWESFHGPYELGADYVFDLARQHGFNYAQYEFPVLEEAQPAIEVDPNPVENSELWASREFVTRNRHRLLWIPHWGNWAAWDGTRWKRDDMAMALAWAQETALWIADRLARQGATRREQEVYLRLAKAANSERYIRNMIALARGDRRIVTPSEAFDADPWLLGTPKGHVDLRTGELFDPDPSKRVSRITSVSPINADCPLWTKFLSDATGGDADYIAYVQRFLGYALTGVTKEHRLHFAYGPGGNGKSVFLETVAGLMGEYAATAPMDSLTATKGDRHPTDVAGLQGARLVTASETQQGREWDEARVKALTGGDRIRVRFMRQDFFEFQPQFKLLCAGNHRPQVRNLDDAMRRRLVLLPFMHKPPREDRDLKDKLKKEWDKILFWMIQGCRVWQKEKGLGEPAEVMQAATKEYFKDEDPIGRWIEERVAKKDGSKTGSTALYEDWCDWCKKNGEEPRTHTSFSVSLKQRGWETDRVSTGTVFLGFELRPREAPELENVA